MPERALGRETDGLGDISQVYSKVLGNDENAT